MVRRPLTHTSDILSFYKEELAGEWGHHISIVAKCRGISHIEALDVVAREAELSCGSGEIVLLS